MSTEIIPTCTSPLQIAILVTGNWRSSRLALEYLVLLLNAKQNLFEYQLLDLNMFQEDIQRKVGKGSDEDQLINDMTRGDEISTGKLKLKHVVHNVACALRMEVSNRASVFDSSHNPEFFIFITTSKHTDKNFFQDDGTNGFSRENPCRGAIIMTGHHERHLAPPTVIEFVFKFIFRISVKWKFPEFLREQRHYGQKSCLFDFCHNIHFVRYSILHNFICHGCTAKLGKDVSNQILQALDTNTLYGDSIERHPAKVSSDLGFNLSLVKGIYKSNYEKIRESISRSFFSRVGSLCAFGTIILTFYATDTDEWFLGYLF